MDQFDASLRQLSLGPRRKGRFDLVAGHQHRTKPPAPRATDIGRLEPVVGSHQPDDSAMLAMRAERDDDGWRAEPHQPRGWK